MVHRKRKVFLTLKINEPKMHNMHTRALSKPQRFYCGLGLYALHDTKISVLEAEQYMYTSCVFFFQRGHKCGSGNIIQNGCQMTFYTEQEQVKINFLLFSVFRQPAKRY